MVNRQNSAFASEQEQPELATVLRLLKRAVELDIETAMPCTVESFQPGDAQRAATVTVLPAWKIIQLDDQEREVEVDAPPVANIPIGFFALGGFKLTASPRQGDTGILLTFSRDIGTWLVGGGQVDPVSSDLHNLGSSVFLPLVQSIPNAMSMTMNVLTFGLEDDSSRFEIDRNTGAMKLVAPAAAGIQLESNVTLGAGGTGTEPMIKGNTMVSSIQAITVLTAMGPSSTPVNAAAFEQTKSQKHRLD